jgi:hypothetical protein
LRSETPRTGRRAATIADKGTFQGVQYSESDAQELMFI